MPKRRKPRQDSWNQFVRKAAHDLDASSRLIESTVRGTPSGQPFSRHGTDPRGYRVIRAKYRGACLACSRPIAAGTTVRYWFNHGITCRTCTLT